MGFSKENVALLSSAEQSNWKTPYSTRIGSKTISCYRTLESEPILSYPAILNTTQMFDQTPLSLLSKCQTIISYQQCYADELTS